jgi:hypothetical protein
MKDDPINTDSCDSVLGALRQLAEFLKGIEGSDRSKAVQSAQNIDKTIRNLEQDFQSYRWLVQNDLSSKGMLGLRWREDNEAELVRQADGILALLCTCDAPQSISNEEQPRSIDRRA